MKLILILFALFFTYNDIINILNYEGDKMKTIYCVEDDDSIRELVVYALNNHGFQSKGFEDSLDLFKHIKLVLPDLILLDIMLPDDNGYDILKKLRANADTQHIPVIMLTAKSNEVDKVKGLDMGADDFITKPFGVMELISRINAVLRRSTKELTITDKVSIGNITLETTSRIVTVNNKEINLTYKEYELLHYLMINKNIVLTREKLMSAVWEADFQYETRTVDVHIRTLRLKLGDAGNIIQTIRNVGYKIGG